jgi:hypothetical protein
MYRITLRSNTTTTNSSSPSVQRQCVLVSLEVEATRVRNGEALSALSLEAPAQGSDAVSPFHSLPSLLRYTPLVLRLASTAARAW